jgi:hypothetical protein
MTKSELSLGVFFTSYIGSCPHILASSSAYESVNPHFPFSKRCGHSYSREPILKLLKSTGQKRCPMAGCANVLRSQDLNPDARLAKKIKRLNAHQASTQVRLDDHLELLPCSSSFFTIYNRLGDLIAGGRL